MEEISSRVFSSFEDDFSLKNSEQNPHLLSQVSTSDRWQNIVLSRQDELIIFFFIKVRTPWLVVIGN